MPAPAGAAQPQADTDAASLSSWLAVVRTYQKCSARLAQRLRPLGLKLSQHEVLVSLLLASPQTQQRLAEHSYVTKSHMSALLGEMLALGWLTRRDSGEDKRSKLIDLTPAGRSLAAQAHAVQRELVMTMLAPLTAEQILEMGTLSRKSSQALDEAS